MYQPIRNICDAVLKESKINKIIDSEFLRSDFMIERITQARSFWSKKSMLERRKKKQHVTLIWKQEDGTTRYL